MATAVTHYVSNTFTPFLNSVKSGANSSWFSSSTANSSSSSWFGTSGSSTPSMSTMGAIATYVLAVLVIMLFILIIVHFFITPIFQLHPGGPGIIPIPGGDDGALFWNNGLHPQILEGQLPIQGQSWGYSLILDMFIQNPLQFSNQYRILFSRGAVRKATPTGKDTFLGMLDTYNLVVALKPDTNDLVVSVLSGSAITKNEENVVISNVPVQQSFRLGIIVMEKAIEVYLNGTLVKTRKYDYNVQSVTGPIDAALPQESMIAMYPLLKIWNRILSTSEMRYAQPSLVTTTPMGALAMPASSSCSSDSSSATTAASKIASSYLHSAMSSAKSAVATTQASVMDTASQAKNALNTFY